MRFPPSAFAWAGRSPAWSRTTRSSSIAPWNVAVIATGGLSHFPELSLARIGQSDPVFDRRIVKWMEAADHDALAALTAKELHETGSHELLNWLVLLGAVSPARARVRFFGEMGRVDLAALEWEVK